MSQVVIEFIKLESKNNDQESLKDRNLDKVFWFKIGFALIFGVTSGILGMTGIITFIM